jgi:hypothetical protein
MQSAEPYSRRRSAGVSAKDGNILSLTRKIDAGNLIRKSPHGLLQSDGTPTALANSIITSSAVTLKTRPWCLATRGSSTSFRRERHIAMSALGHKGTYPNRRGMSALPSKANIQAVSQNVRYVPQADSTISGSHVYFHALPLSPYATTAAYPRLYRSTPPAPDAESQEDRLRVSSRDPHCRILTAATAVLIFRR